MITPINPADLGLLVAETTTLLESMTPGTETATAQALTKVFNTIGLPPSFTQRIGAHIAGNLPFADLVAEAQAIHDAAVADATAPAETYIATGSQVIIHWSNAKKTLVTRNQDDNSVETQEL